MRQLLLRYLLVVPIVLLMASCGRSGATALKGVWSDPEFSRRIDNILVLGMFEDQTRRRPYELQVKSELNQRGIDASAAIDFIPVGEKLNRETFENYCSDLAIDAVLVSRLVGVDTEEIYTSGYTYAVPYGYHDFYGYYYDTWDYVHTPGYYTTNTTVRVETNLYDALDDKLVWSAASSTYDPTSAYQAIESISRTVIAALAKEPFMARE